MSKTNEIKLRAVNGDTYDPFLDGLFGGDYCLSNESKEEAENSNYYIFISEDTGCEKCKSLNGKVFSFADIIEGENFPPLHPNCRCKVKMIKGSDMLRFDEIEEITQNEAEEEFSKDFDLESLACFSKGMVPSTSFINPLQTRFTSVGIRPKKSNNAFRRILFDINTNENLCYADKHGINTKMGRTEPIEHFNVKARQNSTKIQKFIVKSIDHKKISPIIYNSFKDFDWITDKVKTGGKALAVVGIALDAYDISNTIYLDLNDEDKKLGKKTISCAVGIGGSFTGSVLGAKGGAMGGASIGTIICPGLGTAIGGFVGGIGGGIIGALSGKALATYVVDNTYKGQ